MFVSRPLPLSSHRSDERFRRRKGPRGAKPPLFTKAQRTTHPLFLQRALFLSDFFTRLRLASSTRAVVVASDEAAQPPNPLFLSPHTCACAFFYLSKHSFIPSLIAGGTRLFARDPQEEKRPPKSTIAPPRERDPLKPRANRRAPEICFHLRLHFLRSQPKLLLSVSPLYFSFFHLSPPFTISIFYLSLSLFPLSCFGAARLRAHVHVVFVRKKRKERK